MNNGKSFSLKTMEDGMVLIHSDSTAVSDSMFLLFGGSISKRRFCYLKFFMRPVVAEMYQSLRRQLYELIQTKFDC
uniref:RNA helicase C-terminal domain-containing protein n=1 Tax=Salix viminalis TaxID=40686 RepID=A0A6N2MRR8_SALVM